MRRHLCFELTFEPHRRIDATLGNHEGDGNEDKGFTRKTIAVQVRQGNFGTFLSRLLQNNYAK